MPSIKNFIKNILLFLLLLSPINISASQATPPQQFVSGTFVPSLVLTLVCDQIILIQGVSMNGKLLSISFEELETNHEYQKIVSDLLVFLKSSNQVPKVITIKRGKCI